jgi:LuxR family maltose regulon positive regulatory protein
MTKDKVEHLLDAHPEIAPASLKNDGPELAGLINTLLAELSAPLSPASPSVEQIIQVAGHPLPEPLSERELEVLRLLGEGLTNQQIAGRLFIVVGTVKKHTSNIYGKLGASNRTQAIARARELNLLE